MRGWKMIMTYCLVLFSFLPLSCSSAPSGDVVQTAIAETQLDHPTDTLIPKPTDTLPPPTNTPVPLSEIDLESILLLPGDLPSNYKLSVFYDEIPGLLIFNKNHDFPSPDAVTSMDIDDTLHPDSYGGYEISRLVVMLYNDLTQRDAAYGKLRDPNNFFDTSVISSSDVGENAVAIDEVAYDYVVFIRCNALVFMQTTSDTANYAQRLDERLTPLVCR